ncbi:MAG: tRNA pseudouridine(38-40) synthase TruA [Myxococcota bacterium]|nr:tRNA pseudouridine(38-40) synthase TruA [Myxococcota bacterium]
MSTYAALLEYQGEAFEGWQIQAQGSRTVQGCLQEALFTLTREPVVPRGSGRTDAGVHAEGQVASFVLQADWEGAKLQRALNGLLPADLGVRQVAHVAEGFDALRDATGKAYRYRLWNRRARSPLRAARFVHVPNPLDLEAMREAASLLTGKQDFQAFQAAGSDVKTTVRDLHELTLTGEPGGEIEILARGNGFLRHMVRNLVGTLLEVGAERRPASSMTNLLAQRDRAAAGPTAPAHGLTLERVFYPSDPFETGVGDAKSRDSKGKGA